MLQQQTCCASCSGTAATCRWVARQQLTTTQGCGFGSPGTHTRKHACMHARDNCEATRTLVGDRSPLVRGQLGSVRPQPPCRAAPCPLQVLLSRETLLSTLARLLREDGPRSLDMATAVAGCFYACSCIKELHRQLLDNQVRAAHRGVLNQLALNAECTRC